MAFFRSNPFSIFIFLFFACSFFSMSFAASRTQFQGYNHVGVAARRYLDEASKPATLLLAANRTHRRDPLDGFKFYTGGWNITDKHYAASVAFSAGPLVIIAAIWFLLFGICLFCMCLRRCLCCRKEHYSYSRKAYLITLIVLALLTIGAIWGSVYIYTGQGKFQNSIVDVSSYVLKKADNVITNLSDVMNYLLSAKKIGVGQISLPSDLVTNIDGMQGQINTLADSLRKVTTKNADDIRHFTNPMRTALIYVTTFMLVLALLGLLLSVLGLSCFVYTLMIIGWIAVVGTFIMSGAFLFVHNAVSDTCVAMDEWLQNPTAHSALEEIIPKANNQTAHSIFQGTKGVTFGLVNITNTAINNVYNENFTPGAPLYANRSGPLMPLLCNPFNVDLTDRRCVDSEVDYKNATEVWKNYTCQVSKSGICITQGRITPENYNELTAPLNVSFGLYQYSPFLVDLIDSTYVKETFSDISKKYCPSMQRSSEWMYVGFTVISVSLMFSIMLWVIYARERRRRKSTKKVMGSPRGRQFNVMRAV